MPGTRCLAVVFDLDGLMFNTEQIYVQVGTETLRRRGKEFTAQLRDLMMGRPSDISLQLMIDYHSLTDSVEQLAVEGQTIFTALLDQHLAPMPGLLSLIESLQAAGIPRAIATSSRPDFAYDVLQRFNLVPSFQFVLTAKDVVQGKPHPEIYLEAARRLSIPPAQVMVLEDSQNGCRAAVAAGAFAIAVPGEHSRGHDFSGAQFIADSLEDPRIDQCLGFAQPRVGRLRT